MNDFSEENVEMNLTVDEFKGNAMPNIREGCEKIGMMDSCTKD